MVAALVLGIVICLINVIVHTLGMLSLRNVFKHRLGRINPNLHESIHLAAVMGSVTAILLLTHVVEITFWAVIFRVLNIAASAHQALYDAFMSYTSLGFALPGHNPWRLLEPISTLNGILLAGLSTAVMFNALTRTTENYNALRQKP